MKSPPNAELYENTCHHPEDHRKHPVQREGWQLTATMQAAHKLSLATAIIGGLWMVHVMPDTTGAVFAYVFGVACGGAGSRIAAIVRRGV